MQPQVVTLGLGYIELPTTALIAANNITVHGAYISQKVVDTAAKVLTGLREVLVSEGALVDALSRMVHSLKATAVNVSDVLPRRLRCSMA